MSALALCLAKTGQRSEALVWFKRALALDPANPAVLDDYALAAAELRPAEGKVPQLRGR